MSQRRKNIGYLRLVLLDLLDHFKRVRLVKTADLTTKAGNVHTGIGTSKRAEAVPSVFNARPL
jgi:hypothetical protein